MLMFLKKIFWGCNHKYRIIKTIESEWDSNLVYGSGATAKNQGVVITYVNQCEKCGRITKSEIRQSAKPT